MKLHATCKTAANHLYDGSKHIVPRQVGPQRQRQEFARRLDNLGPCGLRLRSRDSNPEFRDQNPASYR